jgi:DNA-binding transcriptional LysR family regulator
MNPSLRQLKAFLHVARLRSFTLAAEQLHITQAGLSSTIADLEAQLGSRLFDRTTRSVRLTAAGRALLPAAEQSVHALDGVQASIGRIEAQARQTLAVAASPIVADALMPEVCSRMRTLHPHVALRIMDVDRREIPQLVEAGEVDLGLGVFYKATSTIELAPVFCCELALLTSAGSPVTPRHAGDATLAWAELREVPLLGLPADNALQQSVEAQLTRIGRGNEARPTYFNFHTLLGMVEAGLGCAILPSFVLAATHRRQIRVSALGGPAVPVDFVQVNQKGRARAAMEPAFIDCLREVMQRRCVLPEARRKRPMLRKEGSQKKAGRP